MQLLPASVQTVSTNDRVDALSDFAFKLIAKLTKVIVCFAHMAQLTGNEFENDDIVEIPNHRNIVR